MKRKTGALIYAGAANIIIVTLGILMLYPVMWLITASFKEGTAIFGDPSLFPKVWTLRNYAKGWNGIGIVTFST
ncbi:MAG: carbohydrate ABC transporter permease, partial [Treponema sp.]|nr:carbohydrate ABC transporter permease [Treponema sp.]